MPFIAECPFCYHKLRAPDRASGRSVPCPSCGSHFTLVAMAHPPGPCRLVAPNGPGALHSADAPEDVPEPEETTGAPAARPRVSYLGLAAFLLGGLALASASLPGLDRLTLPCAGLGLLVGLAGGWRTPAGRGRLLALGGAGVSAAVLLVAGLWPEVFNPLRGRAAPEAERPLALPLHTNTGTGTALAEDVWVDASREAVQIGDVRVHVLAAAVRAAPFREPGRFRRDRYLVIALRVQNAGAERRVPYDCWGAPATGQDEADRPRLRDADGKGYALKVFGPGVELIGRTSHASLTPGRYVDDLLLFEPPAAGTGSLRLELPGSACGVAGPFRLELPRSMISSR
jgi:hypothetical protein